MALARFSGHFDLSSLNNLRFLTTTVRPIAGTTLMLVFLLRAAREVASSGKLNDLPPSRRVRHACDDE